MKLFSIVIHAGRYDVEFLVNGLDAQNALMRVFQSNSLKARDLKTRLGNENSKLTIQDSKLNFLVDDDI